MKAIRNTAITLVALLGIIILMQQLKLLPAFSKWFRSKPVLIDNTPVLIQNIRDLAQLITIVSFDEVVITEKNTMNDSDVAGFLRNPSKKPVQRKLSLIAKGRIFAGMDLKHLKENDLSVKGDSASLTLPPAMVLDAIVNPADVEIFIEEGRWETEEVNKLKISAREKMLQRAKSRGLLQKAEVKAVAVMESFLRSVGFKKVWVQVRIL